MQISFKYIEKHVKDCKNVKEDVLLNCNIELIKWQYEMFITYVIYNVLNVQIKCEPYWPDEVGEPKQYGDVVVEMKSYSNIKTYDYRVFQIRNVNVLIRYVHLYYLSSLK